MRLRQPPYAAALTTQSCASIVAAHYRQDLFTNVLLLEGRIICSLCVCCFFSFFLSFFCSTGFNGWIAVHSCVHFPASLPTVLYPRYHLNLLVLLCVRKHRKGLIGCCAPILLMHWCELDRGVTHQTCKGKGRQAATKDREKRWEMRAILYTEIVRAINANWGDQRIRLHC